MRTFLFFLTTVKENKNYKTCQRDMHLLLCLIKIWNLKNTQIRNAKEMRFCHKLRFLFPLSLQQKGVDIQTLNSVIPHPLILKWQRFIRK